LIIVYCDNITDERERKKVLKHGLNGCGIEVELVTPVLETWSTDGEMS
jgi:hypothetical protein